ncbi:MAG TPA: YbaK/EbsC family protein, partial [Paracoccus sp. (in: a-proteobacteria)]|nr:YbaK/EbsC family protein [Paracoccus sp. (in: a-proteobacteria)]
KDSGHVVLFITAGGNRVDAAKASAVAGQPLGKADADLIRAETGFAIGGVAPLGHLRTVTAFWDPRLSEFGVVWAAAGTPRHVFAAHPADLLRASGAQPADFTA